MRAITPSVVLLLALLATPSFAADYKLDQAHANILFRATHLDMSYIYGRFAEFSGAVAYDAESPADSRFDFTVRAASLDTGNQKRDEHLRSPDFFNAMQFPTIRMVSRQVRVEDDDLHIEADVTLLGVTRSTRLTLTRLGEGEDPWGKYRVGFATEFTIKRSDFGMDKMLNAVGDEVKLYVSFEAIRQD